MPPLNFKSATVLPDAEFKCSVTRLTSAYTLLLLLFIPNTCLGVEYINRNTCNDTSEMKKIRRFSLLYVLIVWTQVNDTAILKVLSSWDLVRFRVDSRSLAIVTSKEKNSSSDYLTKYRKKYWKSPSWWTITLYGQPIKCFICLSFFIPTLLLWQTKKLKIYQAI